MTDTPSTLDAWSGSLDDELTKLLRRAGARGRLTQHDVVRALPNIELTPEVVGEILRRCREAGIEIDDVFGDLDDLRTLAEEPELPGAELVLGEGQATNVVVLSAEHTATSASRRRLSATLRRRNRLSADRGLERGAGTSDPVRMYLRRSSWRGASRTAPRRPSAWPTSTPWARWGTCRPTSPGRCSVVPTTATRPRARSSRPT
jgi:hypothetical protein